jgi:hypothetical protein
MGTHICQRKPEEVEAEASNFMLLIHPLLFGPHCDRRFILNMDQTPVYFLMSSEKTLKLVGKKNHPYPHVDKRYQAGDHGCDDRR